MLRDNKEKVVEELSKVFAEAKGIYLTDFTGIDVEMINELRREFRQNNIHYRIVKNTLAHRSIRGLSLDDLYPYLTGPTGLAFSFEDPILPGKVIGKFQKKTELLSIKAAILEGTVFDQSTAEKIVLLPSKKELLSKLLASLNSPIAGLAAVLSGIMRNFVGVLAAIKDKKEQEDGAQIKQEEPAAGEAQKESETATEKDVQTLESDGQNTSGQDAESVAGEPDISDETKGTSE